MCWYSGTKPVLKFSSSIRADGLFTPITGSAGVAKIACLKWSVFVLTGGSGVSFEYGPPPVWKQKSHFAIVMYFSGGDVHWLHFCRLAWTLLVRYLFFESFRLITISSSSLSCDTKSVKNVTIFGLLSPNYKHGTHMFDWWSFGKKYLALNRPYMIYISFKSWNSIAAPYDWNDVISQFATLSF